MKTNICNCVSEPVTGIGIDSSFPPLNATGNIFSQVSIPESVTIPEQKPNMEQLVSILETVDVVSTKIVDTGEGTSEEGQILLGKKLIIEVLVKQKVTYVADEPTQSVHAAHFEKPYSIFVVVPDTIGTTPIEDLLVQEKLVIKPYVEDICGVMLDERHVFKCTALFVNVQQCA
ncbi:hypothetical protein [Inediibacterium massiliense]|uniref:hypothetical protein n=1 Tax=Inediibacterium massiliense TaxID=1658111 RepID=UPI0006B46E54|nr:hypothetical protein [Inediibacterium massiliense]